MSDFERRRRRRRRRRRKRNQRKILIIEVILLVFLAVVLTASIWFARKLSLVNETELDESKIAMSNSAAGSESGTDVVALVGVDTRTNKAGSATNSDSMIICVINHDDKSVKLCSLYRDTILNIGDDYYGNPDSYSKANAAYNLGGAEKFLSMVNLNLDLNITDYITVDFSALSSCIDLLGGIDIAMTREEVEYTNYYNAETSKLTGSQFEELSVPDDESFTGDAVRTFHCNGSQAVSYTRIRYTAGSDFRRTSRQRNVLSLMKEKARKTDLLTLDSLLEEVLPSLTTNMDSLKLISLATSVIGYDMGEDDMKGFPFVHTEDSVNSQDSVIPVTLEYNVSLLHEFLFPEEDYSPSDTVCEYSDTIVSISGYGSGDIEYYANEDDYGALN